MSRRKAAPGGRALATGLGISATFGMVAAMAAGAQVESTSVPPPTPTAPGTVGSTAAPSTAPGADPVEVTIPAITDEPATAAPAANPRAGVPSGSGAPAAAAAPAPAPAQAPAPAAPAPANAAPAAPAPAAPAPAAPAPAGPRGTHTGACSGRHRPASPSPTTAPALLRLQVLT